MISAGKTNINLLNAFWNGLAGYLKNTMRCLAFYAGVKTNKYWLFEGLVYIHDSETLIPL